MQCPVCAVELDAKKVAMGTAWPCVACRGVLLKRSALRLHLGAGKVAELWERCEAGAPSAARACPGCREPLRVWQEPAGSVQLELDACSACGLLWFDVGEIDRLILSASGSRAAARPRRPSGAGAQTAVGDFWPFDLLEIFAGIFTDG